MVTSRFQLSLGQALEGMKIPSIDYKEGGLKSWKMWRLRGRSGRMEPLSPS